MPTRKRIFIAVLCLGVAMAVGRPWFDGRAPEQSATIVGVPASPTSQANPSLVVSAPSAVGYKYSINDGPYSVERPLSTPIDLRADVRIGDFTARAGSRE